MVVRCFSQDGEECKDYDFSSLTMAAGLRDALVAAFVKRTAPGAGLTSLESMNKSRRAVFLFDRYVSTLSWPPTAMVHVMPEHIDGMLKHRAHVARSGQEVAEFVRVLARAEGVGERLAGRMEVPFAPRPDMEPKASYSRAEFKRIAEAARKDLRVAAARIRANRETLRQIRAGEITSCGDIRVQERWRLLDSVDRLGDVPRTVRVSGPGKENLSQQRWITRHGTVKEIICWLHLSSDEVAAAAVLLGVLTGENPEVILKTPATHHRADGYSGAAGTAIVSLRKLRRGRRAYMDLALTEVPDWISIPDQPDEVSAKDELHTAFGLYVLLHELTARSRTLVGGPRLLVGYSQSGGCGQGRGLRPIPASGPQVGRRSKAWGLTADAADDEDQPVPLVVRLDLLRLTFIELHQRPVAHSEQTMRTYLVRNRGNVKEYRKVVADTLASEVAHARARGAVAVMSAADVERARTAPEAVAAEQGLDVPTLTRMIAGRLDTVVAACSDHTGGTHGQVGQPCPASFLVCLGCECARALPRHLPVQVLLHDRLEERREQMGALTWAERFAGPHAQLADIMNEHGEAAVHDARHDLTDGDQALVGRLLNRELDLR
ncbi:hypothetical protein OTB20_17095 [Streptomyces sp. H27-H1]|uniref:hypothetical protein n=1 Tax=Streptomyces sp. H27-H1 TaxID=2996461 RepID=UPI00226E14B4|nr:hypothetical protein [Streptomyces sp. H27-H1]MCY0927899.1 hypothetical protein [Streptomyces sp. H27-H1]